MNKMMKRKAKKDKAIKEIQRKIDEEIFTERGSGGMYNLKSNKKKITLKN